MKFSHTALVSFQSPMRKYHPYALKAEKAGKKIYHLNIGQPDIETPKAFFDALHNFNDPVVSYAPSPGIPELIDAICRYYCKIGVCITPEDVLITTGGSEALLIAAQCLLDPGDCIMTPEPFYPNYNTFTTQANGVIIPIHTSPENGYHFATYDQLESAYTKNCRVILLSNPGNPCGTILSEEEMDVIADFAIRHDMVIIADEVYREFVYTDEKLLSFGQIERIRDRLIIVDSVSKRFSACGARIGCLICKDHEFIGHALKFCQSRLSVASIDQVAATALYSVGDDYFDKVREEYKRRRDVVYNALREIPGVVCKCPGGAFYLMAKLPVENAEDFQIWLLEHFEDRGETVMFAPGQPFYATDYLGKSEVRIAYVLKEPDLKRAMELLAKGLEEYHKK